MKSSGKRSEVSIGSRGKPSPHFLSLRKKPDHENIRTNALAGLFERPGREETRKGNDSVDFIGTAPAETPPQDTEAREEVFEEKQVQQDVEEVAPRRRPIVFFLLGAFVLVGAVFVARDLEALRDGGGVVLGIAREGIASLEDGRTAGSAFDFSRAHLSFSLAQQSFTDALIALESLENDVGAVARIIPFERNARRALTAARELSEAGKIAAATGDAIPRAAASGAPFVVLEERLNNVEERMASAQTSLHAIPSWSVVGSSGDDLEAARERVDTALAQIRSVQGVVAFLSQVFAASGQKRYLVFFQNDAELRATGGFWGSYALVDFESGKLVKTEIPDQGTYATQGSLRKRVPPPLPLAYLRDRWELQDANWYFDLPTSARTAQDLFAWSGGGSVDGIITINAQILPKLLEIVGPLAIPSEQKVLTSATVLSELQRSIELEDHAPGTGPKSILQSAGPRLLERLFATDADLLPKLLDTMVQALRNGDIQFALNDDALAEQAKAFGWDGSLADVPGDFLAVVDTNIAGGKTDAVITERIVHDVSFLGEGSLTITTTVTRTHEGSSDQGPFVGVVNRDFIRLYISPRARVVDVLGLLKEPDLQRKDSDDAATPDGLVWDEAIHAYRGEESGKQIIAGWQIVKPGEERSMSLRTVQTSAVDQVQDTGVVSWALELAGLSDETRAYRFFFEPQSGKDMGSVTLRLHAPQGWELAHLAASSGTEQRSENEIVVESDISTQLSVGSIFKRM